MYISPVPDWHPVQGCSLPLWARGSMAKSLLAQMAAQRKGCSVHQLPLHHQVQVLSLLTEGTAIRAIARLTGIHRDTIMRLSLRIGQACDRLHDTTMRDLQVSRLQLDEMWGFVNTKQKNLQDHSPAEYGDMYLWLALDDRSKVVIAYRLGKRTAETATAFLADLRARLRNRPQITTDGFAPYVDAVEAAFGCEVDYASIIKEAGFLKRVHQGNPDLETVSTSLVERCNLTVRMQMRRHARRTNAHSKTMAGHHAAVALHLAFYHWCRVHETLRVTPAMELGLTNHIWSMEELVERAQAVRTPSPPPPPASQGPPQLRLIRGGKR